jgi:hypothetical protein
MRILNAIALVVITTCLSVAAVAQSQFVGKWQTTVSQVTGKSTITVDIVKNESQLIGKVTLVNPDRSEIEMPILNSVVKGQALEFETDIQGTLFNWRLTLKGGGDEALLHGSDQRPSKGGQGGEMVIDEHVFRRS